MISETNVRTFAASLVGNLVGRGTGGELRGALRLEVDDLCKAALRVLGSFNRRERIASGIMTGLAVGRHIDPQDLAATAVKCADALIAELDKEG